MPYGEALTVAGEAESPFQFTGKKIVAERRLCEAKLDSETGLYYFGARYYDPVIRRWITIDPLAHKFPDLSPYNYSYNNPICFLTQMGMRHTRE